MCLHEIGEPPLDRRNADEGHELVHSAQLLGEGGRRHAVAGLPARHVVGLAE